MEYYQDVVLVEKQEKQDYSRRMTPKKHKFGNLTVSVDRKTYHLLAYSVHVLQSTSYFD